MAYFFIVLTCIFQIACVTFGHKQIVTLIGNGDLHHGMVILFCYLVLAVFLTGISICEPDEAVNNDKED